MILQGTSVQPAIQAYRARYAAGNGSGESAEPGAIKADLAALVLDCLGPLGLRDAYPRFDGGMPRAFASDPPFWFTRPFLETPGRFVQETLGGHAALGPVPGGQVRLEVPLEGCIALGASNGDPALLDAAYDTWLFYLAWFLSLNRTLGGLVPEGIGLEDSAFVAGDVRWGGDWYCVRWPLPLHLTYIMPASG